jgi:hypothetical protein
MIMTELNIDKETINKFFLDYLAAQAVYSLKESYDNIYPYFYFYSCDMGECELSVLEEGNIYSSAANYGVIRGDPFGINTVAEYLKKDSRYVSLADVLKLKNIMR